MVLNCLCFTDLEAVQKMFLINSEMINDNCLHSLNFISHSLSHLEIERCPDVTISGILSLSRLNKLQYLRLHKLDGLTSSEWKTLQEKANEILPNCQTHFGEADFIEAEHALPPPSE